MRVTLRHEAIEMRAVAAGILEQRRPEEGDDNGGRAVDEEQASGSSPRNEHRHSGERAHEPEPEDDRRDHVTIVFRASCRCQRPVRRTSSRTSKA